NIHVVLGSSKCYFFQAEDGIRDDLVTGVQTCALPIWPAADPGIFGERAASVSLAVRPALQLRGLAGHLAGYLAEFRAELRVVCRSEERRVGKECSGW